MLLAAPLARGAELLADVIVYGATEAGCCAAVAAAREGASVILLAPDQHLGGLLTSGACVTHPRAWQTAPPGGLFLEWHRHVEADYRARGIDPGYRVDSATADTPWVFEPQVALRVTRRMLDDSGVLVLAGRRLQTVAMNGLRLLRLHTTGGDFKGKVFIDASTEGDLATLCGIPLIQAAGGGKPAEPAEDEPAGPPPPVSETLPFRLCLTEDSQRGILPPQPAPSDPLRFENLRSWLAQNPDAPPLWEMTPLPNGKCDVRFDLSGPLSGLFRAAGSWCGSDPASRAALWQEQRQRVLQLWHFLVHDPAVPPDWRRQWRSFRLAADEYPGNAHWPPLLPLAEGRRMIGASVLTLPAVLQNEPRADPVTIRSLPGDQAETGPPLRFVWRVPFAVLLPQTEACENLLSPATPSCDPALAAALWHEPTLMALGQVAGIAAALVCGQEDIQPFSSLEPGTLRARLRAHGLILEPPPAAAPASRQPPAPQPLTLDDSDAERRGPWRFSSHLKPHHGEGYHHDGRRAGGDCKAVFRFTVTETARYDLLLAYTTGRDRATNVPVTIETGGRQARLLFDQTQPPPAGSPFRRLATLELQADEPVTVTLGNQAADGYVVIDGLRVLRSPGEPAP